MIVDLRILERGGKQVLQYRIGELTMPQAVYWEDTKGDPYIDESNRWIDVPIIQAKDE